MEWIGHQRECKQLVLRFGHVAAAAHKGERTATILDDDATVIGEVAGRADTLCDFAARDEPLAGFLFEAHPAVRAAGLVNALAQQFGLLRVPDEPRCLLGTEYTAEMQANRAMTAFEILATGPFDRRRVKKQIDAMNIGQIEVKTHAREINPATEQSRLTGNGIHSATLFVLRSGKRLHAIITRRLDHSD